MIKIIESRLLVEKQMDDILNGLVKRLADDYNVDIENTTFTKTDPNQLKEGQPILFIFCWWSDLRTKKLHYESYTHNIPGIPTDNKTIPYNFDLRTRDNRDLYVYFRNRYSENRPINDDEVLLPKHYVDFSFEELTKYCYAAYVVDAKFQDERNTQMLIKSTKSSKENTELLTKFMDFYKLVNDIVKSMPESFDDSHSPTSIYPRNLRRSLMILTGTMQDLLNRYNNATKWNRPAVLANALNAMKNMVDDIDYYRNKYHMDKLIDKYVK